MATIATSSNSYRVSSDDSDSSASSDSLHNLANAVDEKLESMLHDTLKEKFGYDEFLPGQCEVMKHLLRGDSAAAVFPTGGGKSLCYQLTSLLLPGVTLVVSPLIALMKDQIDALTRRGIAAVRLLSLIHI